MKNFYYETQASDGVTHGRKWAVQQRKKKKTFTKPNDFILKFSKVQ
jgi:hypothetical protein